MMVRTSHNVFMLSTLSILLLTNLVSAYAYNLKDFAGPPPGYKNIYSCEAPCDSFVLHGKSFENDKLVMDEIIHFTKQARNALRDIPENITVQKKIYAKGNELIENYNGNENILIKNTNGKDATWKQYATAMIEDDNGAYTKKQISRECRVESVKKGQVLSLVKQKVIITVKCEPNIYFNHIGIRQYASGVGLIESAIVNPINNTSTGGQKLIKIEKIKP